MLFMVLGFAKPVLEITIYREANYFRYMPLSSPKTNIITRLVLWDISRLLAYTQSIFATSLVFNRKWD